MKFKIVVVLCVAVVLAATYYFRESAQVGETCSPVRDVTVCVQFKCETGEPLSTFGGAGACSDDSKPIILKTWTK